MLCTHGKQIKTTNGNVLFVCQYNNIYNGKQCPFVKICAKIMDYKMIDKIDCHDFIPK